MKLNITLSNIISIYIGVTCGLVFNLIMMDTLHMKIAIIHTIIFMVITFFMILLAHWVRQKRH